MCKNVKYQRRGSLQEIVLKLPCAYTSLTRPMKRSQRSRSLRRETLSPRQLKIKFSSTLSEEYFLMISTCCLAAWEEERWRMMNFLPSLRFLMRATSRLSSRGRGISQLKMSLVRKLSAKLSKVTLKLSSTTSCSMFRIRPRCSFTNPNTSRKNSSSKFLRFMRCHPVTRFWIEWMSSCERVMILESSGSVYPDSYFSANSFDSSFLLSCRKLKLISLQISSSKSIARCSTARPRFTTTSYTRLQ